MAISDKVRQHLCAAANYRCEYCRTSSKLTGMPLVMDHILPQVAGGSDEPENIAAACYRCNEFKGSKTHASDPGQVRWYLCSILASSLGQSILPGRMEALIL
jgi:5-methylcytosine-specific restriction endonuclease McrA